MRNYHFAIVYAVCLPLFVLIGCGESKNLVELKYDRPATYQIPENIRKLAIAEFGGTTENDRRWGDIASDVLADQLEQANRAFERYQLVDRKRLKAIMDERDLQIAIADSASAGKIGKLANVDAMIYGKVHVVSRDEHATRQVFDFATRSTKTVPYIKRYCMTAVNFTMDDINTSKTLTTVSVTREYDSDKDKEAGGNMLSQIVAVPGSSKTPPADQVLNRLITECVTEFISRVSPHKVTVTEHLQNGKSKVVSSGNKLAMVKEYNEAMDCYLKAIELKPDDHGAMFNAGLMYEAMGKLDKAFEYYNKAFKLKDDEKYIAARQRVRVEAKSEMNDRPVQAKAVEEEQAAPVPTEKKSTEVEEKAAPKKAEDTVTE
jgi:tetratricopeptide (TPR) repeat protein